MKRIATIVVCLAVLGLAAGPTVHAQGAKGGKKVQQVKLTVDQKGEFVVTPSTVTKGVPVKMEVDLNSVKGCARTVVIDAYKVKKTVKEGDTTIEFTPTKAGPVQIVCGMNMVRGSFTVQ